MKPEAQAAAREMRRSGASIKEIAGKLGVSPSSASVWTRDIELTQQQLATLCARNPALNGQLSGGRANASRRREERERWQQEGRSAARRGDPLHAFACALYWGEGSRQRNHLTLCNTDPELMRFWLGFLRANFQPPVSAVVLRCGYHSDHHLSGTGKIEAFWLEWLGLPEASLRRSIVDRRSRRVVRLSKHQHGVCRLTLFGTRYAQHVAGAIQEYASFNRPDWPAT